MPLTDSQTRYVNFYTDFAFKKLFGTEANKDLLLSFLNSCFEGKEIFHEIKYLNSEHLGASANDRKAVFDVYCENEKGEKILIEMQNAEQEYFKDRSIYYSTFPIREQAKRSKSWDYELKRVYTICFLNFTFDDQKEFSHEVQLIDNVSKKVFYDKLTYYYLEMPKFKKTVTELETLFDKWLYAIKHLCNLDKRPTELKEAIFTKLFEEAEIAKYTPEERQDYEESLKNFRDWYSCIKTAEDKGREEGREEGILQVAKSLKSLGTPIETIIEATGLTREEIENI